MSRVLSRLGFTAVALIAGPPSLIAQTSTTGSINGMVTDVAGNPVSGATIRITSGQVVRTATSASDGHYVVGLMNAGGWAVSVSKAGYTTAQQNVSISINSTITANFKIAKEGGATVEVVSTSSTMDTTATTTGSSFSVETLSEIPKGRDINDMAFMTPGVTTSGFNSGPDANLGLGISIAGASGAENSFSIDGLKTNDMRYGGQGVSMINEFVDQVDVQTGGYKPEYSAMGGVFNILTKSGSNDFAGSTWLTLSPNTLMPNPKQNPFYAEGKASSVYDLGAWVGGPILKDRLFYSIGVNYQQTNSPSYPNLSGQSVASTSTPNYQFFGKFNYYLNTENQVTLSYFGNNQDAKQGNTAYPSGIGNEFDGRGDGNVGGDIIDNTSNVSLIYDVTLSPTMTLSAKIGQSHILNKTTFLDQSSQIVDSSYYFGPVGTFSGGQGAGKAEPGTRWVTGGGGRLVHEENTTTQASLDFSWVLGNHALKAGFSHLKSKYAEDDSNTGGQRWDIYIDSDPTSPTAGDWMIQQRVYINNSEANAEFDALYIQDTWQATPGLNVFYGFRAEHQLQMGSDGKPFMSFQFGKYIQPRLGFTWDPIGNATSKFSGSFAWYYEEIPQRMAIRTFGNEIYKKFHYGTPYNNADPANGPLNNTTASYNPATHQISVTGVDEGYVDYSTGWSHDPLEDNLKLPRREEIQLGYEQQVNQTTTLGIHGHYRKLTNAIEDSEITDIAGNGFDPADPHNSDQSGQSQAILWNPRSGPISWTSPFSHKTVTVDNTLYPKAYNEYKAVDVSYTYKSTNDMLYFSYTWSRNYGTYEGLISPTIGQPDGNITASFDYWPYVGTGLLAIDHTNSFKAYGFHKFGIGAKDALTVGFNFIAQTGSPYSLQDDGSSTPAYQVGGVNIGDPGYYGNATFQNGLMGNKGRTPFVTKLDINITYETFLTPKVKLEPLLEIYNVMNARPALFVQQQATDQNGIPFPTGYWSSPSAYQPGRSVRFGARLRF